MLWVEIAFVIVVPFAFLTLSGALSGWVMRVGAVGPEGKAKVLAIAWRLSEAAVAILALWVLWGPMLHAGASGGFALAVAAMFTLLFGGVYVGGSLFAAVTVPLGSQMAYFRDRLEKMDIVP